MMSSITNQQSTITNPWVPPFLMDSEGGPPLTLRARLSNGERQVLKRRRPIRVSAWAERHRVVSASRYPGPWQNSLTPYLTGIMDAMAFPSVRTGILCKAPQIGGSECVNNFVGYAIDRDPGPVLYIYPDALTGRENMKDRILPMIEDSRRLRSYMTGWEDDKASLRIKLTHMPIYLAWAGSASRLGNKSIKHVIFDETDKYPDAGKRETDPIRLGEKRVITYQYDHKILKISTPTIETGPIWVALTQEAQVIFDYHVKCPECGAFQRMEWKQIQWDAEGGRRKAEGGRRSAEEDAPTPKEMRLHGLAYYVCPACGCVWDDGMRDEAVAGGQWMSRAEKDGSRRDAETQRKDVFSEKALLCASAPLRENFELFRYLEQYRPKKIGFHLPSWISPFVSLSEVVAVYLEGLHDINAYKDFVNAHQAYPWIIRKQERKEDAILTLKDDRPRGLVPASASVSCLTAGVDTQDAGFWYEIRAWGWGLDLTSWGIREGYVETFSGLEQILWEDEYRDAEGNSYMVRLVIQDAMGHRTSEVYDFSRMHRGYLLPFQGVQQMASPYTISDQEFYPGTKKPIPGGIKLLRGNVTYFKNTLSGKLSIAPGDPGAWMLNSETPFEWARHMCAEFLNEKGVWECKAGEPNHGWDCSVYNLVAAELLGVRHWRSQGERRTRSAEGGRRKAERGARNYSNKGRGGGYQRPGWMNR